MIEDYASAQEAFGDDYSAGSDGFDEYYSDFRDMRPETRGHRMNLDGEDWEE